jgi:alkanesulfonate monooxygenase SsuD/methylene tetrahydromethanopterin reductase-like flavin-dependent oxidoreductase (luciferase family)
MKVSLFNGMPYGPVRERPRGWPVPNELFEPEQAVKAAHNCMEEVAMADELGFDWIACAEHHYSPMSLAANVNVLAAAICQHVKRARIAVLGALIPLNNPVRIAEEYALIDALSGGRLIAGLLRGAPYEYLVYSVKPAESRSRFEEAWELILKAWTATRPFGWEGRHYHFRNVSIWPRPVQQPVPPIFVSGTSRDSGEFAARKKVGLGLAFTNRPLAAEAARFYRDTCAEHGWQPAADQVIYQAPIYVADTDEKAFADFRPVAEGGYGGMAAANRLVANAGFYGERDAATRERYQDISQEFRRTLEDQVELGQVFCGGPESVVCQLRRLRDEVGCGVVNLIFQRGVPRPMMLASIELFAREVLPQVREL